MNIVIIPCHRRADFLTVCLERIMAADGASENFYIIAVDRGYAPEVLSVARLFPLPKLVHVAPRHPFTGPSYNILEAYREALRMMPRLDARRIYLIEEDVWISKDFFRWHEQAAEKFRPLIASCCRNQNERSESDSINALASTPLQFGLVEPAIVYEHLSYQSLGVSFDPMFLSLLMHYVTEDYYRDMVEYCKANFPPSHIPEANAEQDGLIHRVCLRYGARTLYAAAPRAFHAGFTGANRDGRGLTGSLMERVRALKEMTAEEMNALAPEEFADIVPCDPEGYGEVELRLPDAEWGIRQIARKILETRGVESLANAEPP